MNRTTHVYRRVLTVCTFFVALNVSAMTIVEPTTGIAITVTEDGVYTIQSQSPAMTFTGALPGRAVNIRSNSGHDQAGDFREILFDERGAAPRRLSIRTWVDRSGVLLTQTLTAARANPPGFPRFTSVPAVAHHMSFAGKWFSAKFDFSGSQGPWLFFDDAGETAVLSAAANFMVATLNLTPAGEIESRIHPAIATLPAGQTHATLLVFEHGINHAMDAWGLILTDLQRKVRPASDADVYLRTLGYWTDNGAAYYYTFDPSKGYAGTLLAIRDEYAKAGLPLGYVQLDSWWYPKGEFGEWYPKPNQFDYGIATYTAAPDLFPDGLASFQRQMGVPLVTHARWIDVKSPYRAKYRMSNNVSVDPQYWNDIASYLKASGVATYEQDWLDTQATAAFNLDDQDAFMDGMAHALAANGITMQYCMAMPRHVMQGSKYSNLTSIRVSEDHFGRNDWPQVVYASRLASAVGIWPWVDVFSSSESANMMFATLTGGVVGTSDALGATDVKSVSRVVRADGVLVKPDTALIPTDTTILNDARQVDGPIVAFSSSDNGGSRAVYILAFHRGQSVLGTFTPTEAGFAGLVYVYDTRNRRGVVQDAALPVSVDVTNDWARYVVVPVGAEGIAIVGDESKFASRGRARVPKVRDAGRFVEVDVAFAPGEKDVRLRGYAPHRPAVAATTGTILGEAWNQATGVFDVNVAPDASGAARIMIGGTPPQKLRPE